MNPQRPDVVLTLPGGAFGLPGPVALPDEGCAGSTLGDPLPKHVLPPALAIHPIAEAYRPASRLLSLGVSALVWSCLGGSGFLAYRLQLAAPAALNAHTQAMSLLLADPDHVTVDGGGHQGAAPAPAPVRPPAQIAPPPPQPALSTDAPVPSALPTEPVPAPPPPLAPGVAGGTGTGNGYGTGSGTGTGTGSGSGSGEGAGSGIQAKAMEPVVVPYAQIGLLKVINPVYPDKARRVGLEGQVVVRVTIDENGVPVAFHVVGGEELFVKETLKVLPHWRFAPVVQSGRKVRATFDAVLRFSLA